MTVAAPGTGWPGDPATPDTPVARTAADVRELAATAPTLAELVARESVCRACPRLVRWREQVAATKRRSYQAEPYWGRPVPGWGDEHARILITGLAPAAHGGNRTGRMFTGDRSGDWLFASLYRSGLAAQATSVTADDGQRLIGTWVGAAVRCAPPANRPEPVERDNCAPWLAAEVTALAASIRVIVALGSYAWQATWPALRAAGFQVPRPRPAFGHAAETIVERAARGTAAAGGAARGTAGGGAANGTAAGSSVLMIGCYHPSQQNTFTGRVTPEMLDAVFARARDVAYPAR
ncbi:MAG TPA: uracil-DNA glycosylase [Trebonia sp.]|nr:uracil-DNA glycosylase [Trebonia sp.]